MSAAPDGTTADKVEAALAKPIDKRMAQELVELCKDVLFAWEEAKGNPARLKTLIGYTIPDIRNAVSKVG